MAQLLVLSCGASQEGCESGWACLVRRGRQEVKVDVLAAYNDWVMEIAMPKEIHMVGLRMSVVGDKKGFMRYRRNSEIHAAARQTEGRESWFTFVLPGPPADDYRLTVEIDISRQHHAIETTLYTHSIRFVDLDHRKLKVGEIFDSLTIIPDENATSHGNEIQCKLLSADEKELILIFSLPQAEQQTFSMGTNLFCQFK
ncbi:hypothetical protein GUITHDRAFT_139650 [Guillardia theta CCMP2712]|uniref:Uncharacterized protein n=1 Tax=Guillardia theta (strain CCMP2712) TaxID=905079 RepID=L1J867_GUITC|nr:hypothetical protein GUITHDRAFT_139650 [Guillardia theta CCMP2712]EKX44731.1 hypothetical protein GUITHDRAFT_139650 [Guillardia theta CCMP2712]|eukprot:XP_005831711.1 hypothetical protein GUITHDRAFT_139650 [Guillardia theta CCMP2712]